MYLNYLHTDRLCFYWGSKLVTPIAYSKKKGWTANLFILLPTRSTRLIMI